MYLVEGGAGNDGDASLMELVDLLSLLGRQLHGEQQVLSGAVQVDRQHDLGRVRH